MKAESLAAGLCAFALILAGTAWAKKPQPLPPPPGGVPSCQQSLNTCTESLGACADELDTCAGDLGTCATNLDAANASLTTCTADLGTCNDDLAACEDAQVVFPGDGAGSGAPLAYEECSDGLTVADLNTGLLWERKVLGGQGSATCLTELHGVDSTCTWAQATGDWIGAVNAESGTGYAGFDDWRVPNVRELQSIVDYGTYFPAINAGFPGETASSLTWSATTDAINPFLARAVDFSDGDVSLDLKSAIVYEHVRAVRSGPCP